MSSFLCDSLLTLLVSQIWEGIGIKAESKGFERKHFETQKIIRNSLLALVISTGSIISLLFWIRLQGERIVLNLHSPWNLAPALGCVFLAWFIDTLRLSLITGAWQKRITLRNALAVVLSTHFLAGITPSNTGGGAAEIYLLHRLGFNWGEASSLSLSCGFFYQIGFLLLFFLIPAPVPFRGFLKTILVIFLSYGFGFSLFFFVSQNQRAFPRIITKLVQIPPKYFPHYAKYDEKKVVSAIQDFLWEIRSGFELLFYKKPYYSLLNVVLYALHFFFLFATTHFIILSLGSYIPLLEVVKRQVPVFFLFRLTPTPGGSGGIEFALVSAFTPFLGENYSGSLILLWRALTYYLTLVVGGGTFLRIIKRS